MIRARILPQVLFRRQKKDYCDEHGISYVEKTGTTTGEIQAGTDSLVAEKSRRYFYTTGQHCYDSRTCDF